MALFLDLFDAARLEEDEGGVVRAIERTGIVDGVTGSSSGNKYRNALVQLELGGVFSGSPHPAPYDLLTLRTRDVEPLDSGSMFRVFLRYELSDDTLPGFNSLIEGEGRLESTLTRVDVNGTEINTVHNGVTKAHEVQILAPREVVVFEKNRREIFPRFHVRQYLGMTNSSGWNGESLAEVWLCERITYRVHLRTTNPITWTFRYVFRLRDPAEGGDGWNYRANWSDDTGSVGVGLVNGTGTKAVRVYERANFNDLELL